MGTAPTNRFREWLRLHAASIVLVTTSIVASLAIAGVWSNVQELHRHEKQQLLDHCKDDNDFRADVTLLLHRWADLGIPPEEHAAQVAQFLTELDARMAPLPCPSP